MDIDLCIIILETEQKKLSLSKCFAITHKLKCKIHKLIYISLGYYALKKEKEKENMPLSNVIIFHSKSHKALLLRKKMPQIGL